MAKKKQMTFQESMERLQCIVACLEEETTTVEDSVSLYKEGVQLSLQCNANLAALEEEVMTLQKTVEGTFHLTPWSASDFSMEVQEDE